MDTADIQRIRQTLEHFLDTTDVSRRKIAESAGIDPSQLGRFLKGESGLSDERLTVLDAAIQQHPQAKQAIISSSALHVLAKALQNNQLTLFVGAGLSRQAEPPRGKSRLPLWGELAAALTREILGDTTADELSALNPLDQLDCLQAEGHKADVLRLLRDRFLDDDGYQPSPAHEALAKLPWKAVITTNYDSLLAHRKVLNQRFPIVTNNDLTKCLEKDVRLVHLNGDLRDPHTLFSDDFQTWAERNPRVLAFLQNAVSPPNRVLFVGYSFSDPFLIDLLARVRLMSTREGFPNPIHAWMWRLEAPKKLLLKHRYNVEAQTIHHDSEWERAFNELLVVFQNLGGQPSPSAMPPASPELRQKYHDLQKQEYERANLSGLYIGEAYRADDVLMEKVFVTPSLCLIEESPDTRGKGGHGALRGLRNPEESREEWTAPHGCRNADEWLDSADFPCLVILGDPGSGKSSLLQKHMLDRLKDWAADPAKTFPIYLRLSLWEKECQTGTSLHDYALTVINQDLGISDPEWLRPWLTGGPVQWLLDGIDEVRDPARREALLKELERLRAAYPQHRWSVTTRPSGYRDVKLPKPWEPVQLAPLDNTQSLDLLRNWADLLQHLHKLDTPYYVPADLFAELGSQAGLSPLRRNPLLLTMIVLFYRDNYRLPKNRWEFYTHATQCLRMSWVRFRSRSAAASEAAGRIVEMGYYDALLPQLAIEAMRSGTAVLSREQVAATINTVLPAWNSRYTATEIAAETDLIFNQAIALIGVFVDKGGNRFGFLHLTFQEYYAAKWLHTHEQEAASLVEQHGLNPDWQEVWELYALGLEGNASKLDALHHGVGTDPLKAMPTRLHWLGLGTAILAAANVQGKGCAYTRAWGLSAIEPTTKKDERIAKAALVALASWEREYPADLREKLMGRLNDANNERAHAAAKALGEQTEGRELRAELLRTLCQDDIRQRGFAEYALMQKADSPLVQRALFSLYHGSPPEGWSGAPPQAARLAAARALGGSVPALQLWDHGQQRLKIVQLTPEVAITFVLIQAGSVKGENGKPIKVSEDFWLAQTPLPQAQWEAVMGSNPSHFQGPHLPVECVSWLDIAEGSACFNAQLTQHPAFIAAFGAQHAVRLPASDEWEYACRAGTETPYHYGDSLGSDQANIDGNYPDGDAPKGVFRERTVVVGSFEPNKLGLHDMHGNVWEWCADWYDAKKTGRVMRGGGWGFSAVHCRSSFRLRSAPDNRYNGVGFRPAVSSVASSKPGGKGRQRSHRTRAETQGGTTEEREGAVAQR